METQEALLSGASIGLTIAAPIGPMAIMVIRRTLSGGALAGLATGVGASTVNLAYATLALCGIEQLARQAHDHRTVLLAVTALALLFFAGRMLRPRSPVDAAVAARKSLLGCYTSALAFNLVNPMSFALVLGAVTAASGLASRDLSKAGALAGGVFLGSIMWWVGLVSVTATVGARFSPQAVRTVDVAAGLVIFALAICTAFKMF